MAGKNQRQHLRIGLVVDIELTLPSDEVMLVQTKNISDGGLYLVIDTRGVPPIGTEVQVRIKNQLGDGEEAPINRAVVVRHEADGVGLKFLDA
ncbi:MAG: PilZ domain-containing protein [Gammaproteobacteria bacterium]|nr:PilZ domain-containing protein [Gammaproteobacteria bacterium]MCW8910799.1 PilZ domain-containing protein [Gammaproteobacteria bacterium]MCW9003838.1 PilZ domain-containing protein [Gammaproteobacteria bacterium]